MLNFEILKNYPKAAIECRSEDEAKVLCDEMREQYPSFMRFYGANETKYDLVTPPVCYAPHIYDLEENHMQLTTTRYWVNHGYTILKLEDLSGVVPDLGEIQNYELSIESLFLVGG